MRALIDTGSFNTWIEEAVCQQLQLNVVEQDVSVRTGVGQGVASSFLVEIEIPGLGLREFAAVMTGPVVTDKHDAVLGRSQLLNCTLVYDGPYGSARLSR